MSKEKDDQTRVRSSGWFWRSTKEKDSEKQGVDQSEQQPQFSWEQFGWSDHVELVELTLAIGDCTSSLYPAPEGAWETQTSIDASVAVITLAGQAAAPRGRFSISGRSLNPISEAVLLEALRRLWVAIREPTETVQAAEQSGVVESLVYLLSNAGIVRPRLFLCFI